MSFNDIFEHVPPCRKTTLQFASECFQTPVIFQLLQQKYVIQTSSSIVQQLIHSVCIYAEYIPNIHGQEMMWVRQCPHFPSFSTWEPFPAILMSSPLCDCSCKFVDHRMSGLPIRAKYKHFNSIWDQTCDNSPTDSSSSCLN